MLNEDIKVLVKSNQNKQVYRYRAYIYNSDRSFTKNSFTFKFYTVYS